jgi:hypothetical protein
MNGRITRSETYDAVCAQCRVFWRVCLLVRSPVDDSWLCPECFAEEVAADAVAANENVPACECGSFCFVCTPGA